MLNKSFELKSQLIEKKEEWKNSLKKFQDEKIFHDLLLVQPADSKFTPIAEREQMRLSQTEDKNRKFYHYKGFIVYFDGFEYARKGKPIIPDISTSIVIDTLQKNKILLFQSQANYGEFLAIQNQDQGKFSDHNIRFDLDFKTIKEHSSEKGEVVFDKEKLVAFTEQCIAIADELNIGLSLKPLYPLTSEKWNGKYPIPRDMFLGMGFRKGIHIYPAFKKNMSKEQMSKHLLAFFKKGKELWGNAFIVNPPDFSMHLIEDFPELEKDMRSD